MDDRGVILAFPTASFPVRSSGRPRGERSGAREETRGTAGRAVDGSVVLEMVLPATRGVRGGLAEAVRFEASMGLSGRLLRSVDMAKHAAGAAVTSSFSLPALSVATTAQSLSKSANKPRRPLALAQDQAIACAEVLAPDELGSWRSWREHCALFFRRHALILSTVLGGGEGRRQET